MTLQTRSEILYADGRIRLWVETGPAPAGALAIVSILRQVYLSPEGLSLGESVVRRTTQRGPRSQRAIDLLHVVTRLRYREEAQTIASALPSSGSTL